MGTFSRAWPPPVPPHRATHALWSGGLLCPEGTRPVFPVPLCCLKDGGRCPLCPGWGESRCSLSPRRDRPGSTPLMGHMCVPNRGQGVRHAQPCLCAPQAVCCPDHVHCCPQGYTCDPRGAAACRRGHPPALGAQEPGTSCSDGSTCCRLSLGTWAAPLEQVGGALGPALMSPGSPPAPHPPPSAAPPNRVV
uniref:Granulins domain-containing protein n=1 Tax=Malurus cyaneus samueli TaxID=2593467 RepID=A0A8C5TMY8_9PASS